jgi:hypothetical protein
MTPRTIHWRRVLTAAAALALIELIWAPGHEPLRRFTDDLLAGWTSPSVLLWPMHAWKALLEGIGLPTTEARGLGAIVALLVGLPLLIVGGVVLEAIWFAPYVVVGVLLYALSLAVTVHLVPTVIAAAAGCRLVPEWRQYFFPLAAGPLRCMTAALTVPLPIRAATAAARPAVTLTAAPVGAGRGRLCTMGPAFAHLANRRDALTSSRFETGERFILCGGTCGRPYKLLSCEFFEYRCPKDGSSLRPAGEPAVSDPS